MLNAKSFLLRDIQGVEKSGLSPPGGLEEPRAGVL